MFELYQIVRFGSTTGIVSALDGHSVQIMWEENTHDVAFVTWPASKWRNSLRGF